MCQGKAKTEVNEDNIEKATSKITGGEGEEQESDHNISGGCCGN